MRGGVGMENENYRLESSGLKTWLYNQGTSPGGITVSPFPWHKLQEMENQWPSCSQYFPGYNHDPVFPKLFMRCAWWTSNFLNCLIYDKGKSAKIYLRVISLIGLSRIKRQKQDRTWLGIHPMVRELMIEDYYSKNFEWEKEGT